MPFPAASAQPQSPSQLIEDTIVSAVSGAIGMVSRSVRHHLRYQGVAPSGKWVSFRELEAGSERYALFRKRCEEAMQRVADQYTDLFDDMVHLFAGRQVARQFKSDISVVLNPLPKVPVMICYWRPDEGLGSSLNLFFDRTADRNLGIGSIFSLAAGLTQMFEKLALRHGFTDDG